MIFGINAGKIWLIAMLCLCFFVVPLILYGICEKELTKRQKEIVKLYLCEGKKQCEISEMLNISQPTTSRVLHTAMDKLQKYMFYCEKALNVYCDLQIREVLK